MAQMNQKQYMDATLATVPPEATVTNIVWTASDPAILVLTPAGDGMTCRIDAGTNLGSATVGVTATNAKGSAVSGTSEAIEVIAHVVEATGLTVNLGGAIDKIT